MAVTRRREQIEEQLDVVDLYAKNFTDDLKYLRNFEHDIVTDVDAKALTVMAMKYGCMKKITEDNAHYIVGLLANIIQKKLDDYVQRSVLQRVMEEQPDKLPLEPRKEKIRFNKDAWEGKG